MNEKQKKRIGKFISLILRHAPEKIGLQLDDAGWADVKELLSGPANTTLQLISRQTASRGSSQIFVDRNHVRDRSDDCTDCIKKHHLVMILIRHQRSIVFRLSFGMITDRVDCSFRSRASRSYSTSLGYAPRTTSGVFPNLIRAIAAPRLLEPA